MACTWCADTGVMISDNAGHRTPCIRCSAGLNVMMPPLFNCPDHGLSYTGACPARADEPDPPAKMTMTMDDWVQRYEAAAGIVLPPPAVGNAQEWRDLCTAQSAEIEALRTSLERALSRIASLSAERDGFRAAAEQHAAELGLRWSASWEHLPCVTEGARPPVAAVDPLLRAIGARPRPVGLLTERGV